MIAPPPPTLPPDTMIGRYRVTRRIGVGGMGEVYEAQHVDLNKRVALKILLPSIASRPEIIARFVREGQATARLRHPHAVDISDVGVDHNVPFLVMEYLDGETLEALLAREGPLLPQRIAELMLPVLAAVKAAHEEDIVHRDLKPANIFLHRSRDHRITPKVLDFGISKMTDEDGESGLTQTSSLLGTPHYMSPEQLRSSKYVDARSDQYALGVILYECVTRQKAFRGETSYTIMNAIANGHFTPPRALVPSLPVEFERMVLRAMSNSRDARYETVHALGCALMGFADGRTRAFWESVFDDEPTTALPSWSEGTPATSSADSVAGARNPAVSTPAPDLRASMPGTAPSPGLSSSVSGTLVGTTASVPQVAARRSRVPAFVAVVVVLSALVAGAAIVKTRPSGAPNSPSVASRAATIMPAPASPPPTANVPSTAATPSAVAPTVAAPTAAAPTAAAPTIAAPTVAAPTAPEEGDARAGRRRSRHGHHHGHAAHASSGSGHASGTNDIPILR